MGIEIKGVDALMSELQQLASRASGETADRALKSGARIILREMRTQVPIGPRVRPEKLRNALRLGHVTKMLRSGTKRIQLGTYEQRNGRIAPHAHLVEYGHEGPAPAPPHPFIRPSFDRRADEAYDEMVRVLRKDLNL